MPCVPRQYVSNRDTHMSGYAHTVFFIKQDREQKADEHHIHAKGVGRWMSIQTVGKPSGFTSMTVVHPW